MLKFNFVIRYANQFVLSTSTLSTPTIVFGNEFRCFDVCELLLVLAHSVGKLHFVCLLWNNIGFFLISGGFGPVVPNGLGIGYNVIDSKVGCVISAYSKERSATEFAEAMRRSLDDIKNVLENTKDQIS